MISGCYTYPIQHFILCHVAMQHKSIGCDKLKPWWFVPLIQCMSDPWLKCCVTRVAAIFCLGKRLCWHPRFFVSVSLKATSSPILEAQGLLYSSLCECFPHHKMIHSTHEKPGYLCICSSKDLSKFLQRWRLVQVSHT